MDTLFFWASKLIWLFLSPGNFLLFLVLGACLAMLVGKQQMSRRLLTTASLLLLLIAFLPLGEWLIAPLENRFPQPSPMPSNIQGIIVLGGSVSQSLSADRGQPQLNDSAERLIGFLDLAIRYPNAKLLFSGGNGSLTQQTLQEADVANDVFFQLGFVNHNINFERESRNTYENAVLSKQMMNPAVDDRWLLVTSAYHMPRSVGVFCQQRWRVVPYPVDYYSMSDNSWRIELNLSGHLNILERAVREWVGLIAYRVTGKSHRLLPGTSNICE